jgi:hypothetical protein
MLDASFIGLVRIVGGPQMDISYIIDSILTNRLLLHYWTICEEESDDVEEFTSKSEQKFATFQLKSLHMLKITRV